MKLDKYSLSEVILHALIKLTIPSSLSSKIVISFVVETLVNLSVTFNVYLLASLAVNLNDGALFVVPGLETILTLALSPLIISYSKLELAFAGLTFIFPEIVLFAKPISLDSIDKL